MAVIAKGKNAVMEDASCKLGKKIVFKQYANKVVVTKYPDMSGVKRTAKQKAEQSRFRRAVAYAKSVLANPEKKKTYLKKLKKGRTVYHTALADFLSGKVK